mmetsp:Transcript_47997/g.154587  ORF Transcript_47997/g.154587 Transcript_47997/m.154587 type:complete len:216 (+) Transcript_47997:307-954(+)
MHASTLPIPSWSSRLVDDVSQWLVGWGGRVRVAGPAGGTLLGEREPSVEHLQLGLRLCRRAGASAATGSEPLGGREMIERAALLLTRACRIQPRAACLHLLVHRRCRLLLHPCRQRLRLRLCLGLLGGSHRLNYHNRIGRICRRLSCLVRLGGSHRLGRHRLSCGRLYRSCLCHGEWGYLVGVRRLLGWRRWGRRRGLLPGPWRSRCRRTLFCAK